jgi:hypothetical protein
MTREEVKLKLDELGVKYDKRLKLEKLLEIYEKNGQNLKDNAGEQEQIEVEAKKDDNEVKKGSNSVVYWLVGEDCIDFFNAKGGGFIRRYSKEAHGNNWLELGYEFARGRELKK